MKSLMANMIKNKKNKLKAEASKNKNLAGKSKSLRSKENVKNSVVENVEIMKESKTLMLD